MVSQAVKGKPGESRGRKATGLRHQRVMPAGLPVKVTVMAPTGQSVALLVVVNLKGVRC